MVCIVCCSIYYIGLGLPIYIVLPMAVVVLTVAVYFLGKPVDGIEE